MAESECFVGDVSGSSESEELDCSLDLFLDEEEGPVIAEDGGGPSDNIPVRNGRIDTSSTWTLMRFLRLRLQSRVQRVQPETKLSSKHRLVNLCYTSYHNKSFAGYNEPVKSVYYINNLSNAYPVACSPRPRDLYIV